MNEGNSKRGNNGAEELRKVGGRSEKKDKRLKIKSEGKKLGQEKKKKSCVETKSDIVCSSFKGN